MSGRVRSLVLSLAVSFAVAAVASAGPVLIDGTDSDDHGYANSGSVPPEPINGWRYIQKGLENLAPQVGNGKKVVAVFCEGSDDAYRAVSTAFNFSVVQPGSPLAGWTLVAVSSSAQADRFFSGPRPGEIGIGEAGIIYISSNEDNVWGGVTAETEDILEDRAGDIASFVGPAPNPAAGGGLYSHSNSYKWLKALIPGVVVTDRGSGGIDDAIALTQAGQAAFPGLTSQELSSGPWHFDFSGDLGSLVILGTSTVSPSTALVNVILGGGKGTSIGTATAEIEATPDPVRVNVTGGQGVPVRVTIRNGASAGAILVVTGISATAVDASTFAPLATTGAASFAIDPPFDVLEVNDGSQDGVLTLGPCQTASFNVYFTGSGASSQVGSAIVVSNDPGDSYLNLAVARGTTFDPCLSGGLEGGSDSVGVPASSATATPTDVYTPTRCAAAPAAGPSGLLTYAALLAGLIAARRRLASRRGT